MLPFGGQGANQAIEDAGAISILFQNLSNKSELSVRLALFEKVRTRRASRIQVLSTVRIGREKEVEGELKQYMEDEMDSMFSTFLLFLFLVFFSFLFFFFLFLLVEEANGLL